MGWRFSPPVTGYGPSYRADADRVTQALWGHFRGAPEAKSVLKNGGTYTDQGYVYSDDIDSADVFYQGGHVYEVDDTEAAALIAAGYSPTSTITEGATLWLRATEVAADWEPTDGLTNSGSGGPSLDAALVTVPQKGTAVTASNVTAVDHPNGRGVQIDQAANGIESFYIPTSVAIGIDSVESGMWTLDRTILVDTTSGAVASNKFFDWYDGANMVKFDDAVAPAIGGVIEWVDDVGAGASSGGMVNAFNDDTLPYGAAVGSAGTFLRPATDDRVIVSMRFDRTAGTYEMWNDGALTGTVDIDDLTASGGTGALGSLYSPNNDPFLGNRMVLHNLRFDRDTAGFDDPAALHTYLATTG